MDYIKAFIIGGILCVIGQILIDKTKLTPARILVGYVVAGVILGAIGIYEPFATFAGAGASVPLTGFGNSLAKGVKEAVEFAMENGDDIVIEKGAQWPRILLFSGTTASEYLENVVYDEYPAPAGFTKGDITFHTRINYDDIRPDSVYIIYYTDIGLFEENYELTQFGTYWYVAVPASH